MHCDIRNRCGAYAVTCLLLLTVSGCSDSTTPGGSPVALVEVTPQADSLAVGATVQLNAVTKDSAGHDVQQPVSWSSSDAAVAQVDTTGLVLAVSEGTATIRASSEGVSGTATVVVRPSTPPPVASVAVSPSRDTLAPGQTVQLTVVLQDSAGNTLHGRPVTWTSGDAGVARVDTAGLVSAVAPGATTITATSEGVPGTAAIVVVAPSSGGTFSHVFVVTEENSNYASVIGSSSMPYLNSLAAQYGLATQYYADTHPSIGNYFMLATGQIITNNDSYSTVVNVDNVVRRLLAAGKTWKSYAEDLPSVGYTGGDTGNYARKHNVFALLSDVADDSTQRKNLVPFTQFSSDLANGTLPDFANVVPNLCNDAHDCSLSTADAWLRTNIAPLLASATFQQAGLLIIVFDEAGSDNTHGGGRVACVVVSPKARTGFQSATFYQHESVLRLILKGLGVTTYPGAAASAADMGEFFVP